MKTIHEMNLKELQELRGSIIDLSPRQQAIYWLMGAIISIFIKLDCEQDNIARAKRALKKEQVS